MFYQQYLSEASDQMEHLSVEISNYKVPHIWVSARLCES
jgi:hypothetical protein